MPKGSPPEVRDAIVEAREGAQRVGRIVRDLQVFSRSAPDEEPPEPADLRLVAEAALNIARGQLEGVRVAMDLEATSPVKMHEGRLVQIAINLLVNAGQAAREAERSVRHVGVRTYNIEGMAVLEVTDNGGGIAPAVRARLFEPFFTTKKVGAGTGLGLSVVDGIVRAGGGRIDLESEVGKGSTFRVSFPTTEAMRASRPSTISIRPTEAQRRILVVDDDPSVTRALRRLLRNERVRVASSVAEAMQMLDEDADIDAILSDLAMPDASGIDFHAMLQKRWPTLSERFVLSTGSILDSGVRAWLDRSGALLLPKPFAADQLNKVLERLRRRIKAQPT